MEDILLPPGARLCGRTRDVVSDGEGTSCFKTLPAKLCDQGFRGDDFVGKECLTVNLVAFVVELLPTSLQPTFQW